MNPIEQSDKKERGIISSVPFRILVVQVVLLIATFIFFERFAGPQQTPGPMGLGPIAQALGVVVYFAIIFIIQILLLLINIIFGFRSFSRKIAQKLTMSSVLILLLLAFAFYLFSVIKK